MRAIAVFLFCFAYVGAARAEEQAKGFLGVQLKDVTKDEADALGWESPHGAKVVKPVPGGPAEKAGILPDDILLLVDGVEVENRAGFIAKASTKAPGAEIKLRILRGGKERRLTVTLGARPVRQDQELARATPGDAPLLQLDTGGHMAVMHSVTFTVDGKYLISASDDKVIRVWDWQAGKIVRAIRGQSGEGNYGKIFAIALSPGGRWLAAGGFTKTGSERAYPIRLFDFESGQLKALLKGHTNTEQSLAFSPDGKRLVSGSDDKTAIIWDVERAEPIHGLEGHAARISAVGFTPDGERAITASMDKTLKLWDAASGKQIGDTLSGHAGRISGLSVAPDGTIASGDSLGEIRLWSGLTGQFLRVLGKQNAEAWGLHFSLDGKRLMSTSRGSGKSVLEDQQIQTVWEVSSGRAQIRYAGNDNNVLASAISADGRFAATAGGNANQIHIWDFATGKTEKVLLGIGTPVYVVGFSQDGRRLEWVSLNGDRTWQQFALRFPEENVPIGTPEAIKESFFTTIKPDKCSLALKKGGDYGDDATLEILCDDKTIGSIERGPKDGYTHISYIFAHDGHSVISGGRDGALIAYDLTGKTIGAFIGHEAEVLSVAPSRDGKYLISGSQDQTVRLWNLKTRELLVTIFCGIDGEWVIWTPQGYYTGSAGADKIVGWQINRGPDKAADYVTAEQLRKHLNRPDIVAKAIQLASAEEAVRTSYGTEFKLEDLLARPAPRLRILSPEADSTVKGSGTVAVKIALDATPDPITRIRIQVNGRQLDDFLPEAGPAFAAGEQSFPVPLAKGKNTIVVTALNEIGWSKVRDGTLTLTNESAGELDRRGTLYILAIGVSKYPGIAKWCAPAATCDLNYTGADAIAFADTAEKQLGRLHGKVVRRVLVNGGEDAPSAANIVDALGVLSEARPNDTVAVFLAGHGVSDGPNYRFVSTDAADAGGKIRPSSVVPWYAIEEAIDQAKGRRLLFIDTCHSANAYNERLGNTAYHANIVAYSAARWDQLAYESPNFRHGLFTQAVVEGLTGAADGTKRGQVDTADLNGYLQRRVPELAAQLSGKPEQNPQFFKGRDAETYTLAAFR